MKWNDSLVTGVKSIDEQHQELIKRINNFLDACMQKKSTETIVSTMNFVEEYVVKHFEDEQKLHISSNYPKAVQHKLVHDNFRNDVKKLQSRLKAEGLVLIVKLEANKLLVDWLISHINGMDKEFAKYYKTL